MKRFAIIGLGAFGLRMLEELDALTRNIIIIDRDADLIAKYGKKASASYCFDAIDEQKLRTSIPNGTTVAIVDVGVKIEVAVMITTYLKRLQIKEIVVKAQTDEHQKVLTMVGATRVIFPDREAAKRITPMLASDLLFDFMPISETLSLAEVAVPNEDIGKTLVEVAPRQNFGLTIIAVKKESTEDFVFIDSPLYQFEKGDVLLVAGSEEHIFSRFQLAYGEKKSIASLFKKVFPKSEG